MRGIRRGWRKEASQFDGAVCCVAQLCVLFERQRIRSVMGALATLRVALPFSKFGQVPPLLLDDGYSSVGSLYEELHSSIMARP